MLLPTSHGVSSWWTGCTPASSSAVGKPSRLPPDFAFAPAVNRLVARRTTPWIVEAAPDGSRPAGVGDSACPLSGVWSVVLPTRDGRPGPLTQVALFSCRE